MFGKKNKSTLNKISRKNKIDDFFIHKKLKLKLMVNYIETKDRKILQ
jgi:hypothetical protein